MDAAVLKRNTGSWLKGTITLVAMKRRDLILGSAGLLVPAIGRSATACPPPQLSVAGGTSVTTTCPASKTTYTTNFPLTENPISEGGRWTNGGIFSKTNVQTSPGKAYGTMVSFDGTHYIDSCACLSGFGPDQQVTCTIANSGAPSGLEVEILLRAVIASDHIFLYEVDCVTSISGISLVRWDNTTANPYAFTVLRQYQVGEAPLADGDQVFASIIGTLITVKYMRAGGAFSTLFTYDTTNDSVKYSSGNPGIGFWNETGSASNQSKLAWSNFTASN
jgi:hypothetical protein